MQEFRNYVLFFRSSFHGLRKFIILWTYGPLRRQSWNYKELIIIIVDFIDVLTPANHSKTWHKALLGSVQLVSDSPKFIHQ